MSDKDSGGHAFPTIYPDLAHTECGMTLRDYFAAKAMAALCAGFNFTDARHNWTLSDFSKLAYRIADAMTEARK